VANTVDGFLAAAASDRAVGRTINLGSGREISIGDLAGLICALLGKPANIECEQARLRPEGSEVERLLADASLAEELLGWRPRLSLEEGLAITIDWLRENLGRYRVGVYAV
jgi:dTDP-glucose 4,6-dehydratase